MLADCFTLTTNNVSTDQRIVLPDTSAKHFITLFASDLNNNFEWIQIKDFYANSLRIQKCPKSEAYLTMLASESVLSRDWEQPEEDEAWIDL